MKDRKKQKPKLPVFHMGRMTVRAIRVDEETGLFYWRTFRYENKKEIKKAIPGWHTQEQAEAYLYEHPELRASGDTGKDEIRTVADLLECWLGEQLERPKLAQNSKNAWSFACRHLKETIGDVLLTALDVTTIDRHQNMRTKKDGKKRGAAVTTVRNELNVLRMAWRWGLQLDYCPNRQLPRAKPMEDEPVYCDYVPTALEFAKVLLHLETVLAPTATRPLRDWPVMYLRLLFAMGPRAGEVASLEWTDIRIHAKSNTALITLGMHEGDRKTRDREFPLDGEVVTHLRNWKLRCTGARVFPVRRSGIMSGVRARHLTEACAKAKVPRFTMKGLRTLMANHFARNQDKVDVGTAAALMGHTPATMWKYYREVSEEDKRRVSKLLRLGQVATVGQLLSLSGDESDDEG